MVEYLLLSVLVFHGILELKLSMGKLVDIPTPKTEHTDFNEATGAFLGRLEIIYSDLRSLWALGEPNEA